MMAAFTKPAKASELTLADYPHVEADARYLPTFRTTMSEVIVPVTNPLSDEIVATIDVENGSKDAFSDDDVLLLEVCAWAIAPLWK